MSRVVVHRQGDPTSAKLPYAVSNRKPGLRLAQNSDCEAASCAKTRVIVDPNAGPRHAGKGNKVVVDLHFELLG